MNGLVSRTAPDRRDPIMSAQALLLALSLASAPVAPPDSASGLANPAIDMKGYLEVAADAARHRESRRVSEDEFIRMSREPGTVILDARSREKYDELHVKGAIHLSFPDIAIARLHALIPDTTTRILIYCNNNFRNAQGPFPSKLPTASLNLSTFIVLYDYGYRNVYELGPLIDLEKSRIEFESTRAGTRR